MKIIFLCTANIQRSKTAEELFQAFDKQNIYRSAGLSAKYVAKAGSTLCTEELLQWADKIYVFEQSHVARICQYTGDCLQNFEISVRSSHTVARSGTLVLLRFWQRASVLCNSTFLNCLT